MSRRESVRASSCKRLVKPRRRPVRLCVEIVNRETGQVQRIVDLRDPRLDFCAEFNRINAGRMLRARIAD